MKLELGYWAIRGLGAPARMMLEHEGVDYTDLKYADAASWFAVRKVELLEKNALANLPYVLDGDRVVTHSTAVYEYLGVKLGHDAFDDEDGRWVNAQMLAECYDLRNALMALVYPFNGVTPTKDDFETKCEPHLTSKCIQFYNKFEATLGLRGKKFLVKDTPSSCDFHLWEMLDQHEIIAKRRGVVSPLEQFPKLQKLYAEFRNFPELAKYFASETYTLPMNSIGGGAHVY